MKADMTDQEYYNKLTKHDWTHAMSDSGYVYEKGAKAEVELLKHTAPGWRKDKFDEWRAYAHLEVVEEKPKPKFDAKPATVASEEKAVHSKVSPSNLKNLEGCPHYESEHQEELKDMHPNTVEGLRVHLEVELYFDPDKEDKLEGQDVELYEGIKQEHIDRAQYAIDYAEKFLQEGGEPDTLVTEPRLHTPVPNTYGRCDLLAIWNDKRHAQIFDWKDGNHHQGDAETNLQAHAYALGVFHEYPEVESVEVHFVYTRREEETVATFTRRGHYQKFLDKVVEINREFDLVHTSGKQMQRKCDSCQFCIHQTSCPQWNPMVPEVVGQSKLQGSDHLPSTWKLEELCELPDEVGKALAVMAFFTKYNSELKDLALSMVRDEDMTIPGQALVESNSGIKCSDPQGAYAASLDAGLPVEDFLETVRTLNAGKLVDKMARSVAASGGSTIAAAKKEIRENLLEEGVLSSGNSYEYLRQSKDSQ